MAPAAQAGHIGLGPGFIDEDQPPGVDEPLISSPSFAVATYVRAILLACDKGLFLTVTPIRRKKRLIIEVSALPSLRRQTIAQGLKRDVRFLGPRSLQKVPVRHQLGGAMAAVSDRLSRAIPFNSLKPFDSHRFADLAAAPCCAVLISPIFTASITRSRKSCEYGFPSPAGLRPANRLKSKSRHSGILPPICHQAQDALVRPVRGKAWTTRVVFDSLARALESGRAWRGVGSVKKLLHL